MEAGDVEGFEAEMALQVQEAHAVEWAQLLHLVGQKDGLARLEALDVVEGGTDVQRDALVPQTLIGRQPVVTVVHVP